MYSKDSKVKLTYIDVFNTNIKHSLGSKVIYNDDKRTLEFHQKKHDDWFLLSDVKVDNLTFKMISNSQKILSKLNKQRFNEFGLTGCLNFLHVDFTDTKIETFGGGCEDSVNIIKSSGQIKDSNIDAEWNEATTTLRQSTEAPRVAQQKAFSLAEGESDVVSSPVGYTVVKLTSVDRKSWDDMAVTEELKTAVRNQSARDDMVSYQAWSKANTEIVQ